MCQQEHDCFYDLRDDDTPLPRLSGEFSVDRFDARAAQVIADHVRSTPLFLYYAIPLVHAPIQAPTSVLKQHKHTLSRFGNHERKVFAAQTLMLDASVATVVAALDAAGLSNDTLLVLASDNGALPSSAGPYPQRSSRRWPCPVGCHRQACYGVQICRECQLGRVRAWARPAWAGSIWRWCRAWHP